MARKQLILDRYEVLGTAGSGGFGTVQIAWDPRIQRKVAIKTIQLDEHQAYRASLPGAQAVAKTPVDTARDAESSARSAAASAQAAGSAPAEEQLPVAEIVDVQDVDDSLESILSDARQSLRDLPLPEVGGRSSLAAVPTVVTAPPVFHDEEPWAQDLQDYEPEGFVQDEEEMSDADADSPDFDEDDAYDDDDIVVPLTIGMGEVAPEPLQRPRVPNDNRWRGIEPWGEYIEAENARQAQLADDPVTALAHLPGLDEARTAAMLHDAHIVTVYDFEVREQTAYLIMEYVEGITLTELLFDYADFLTLDMVTSVFDSVAGALMAAHKAGVLHLDIKPDNILINAEGQVKVTDFGLATLADASGSGTTGGGTIGYMPLEQMRREFLDARTDEWSLAAVTYEMLTGENPFRVRTLQQAESAIIDAELIVPSLCWREIDDQIDDVIFYALDPQREERYANVQDFAEELDKFLGDAAQGREQLALIVGDALGPGKLLSSQDDEPEEEDPPRARAKRAGLFGLFGGGSSRGRAAAEDGGGEEDAPASAGAGRRRGSSRRGSSRAQSGRSSRADRRARNRRSRSGHARRGRQMSFDELDEYVDDYIDDAPRRRGSFGWGFGGFGGEDHIPLRERIPEQALSIAGRAMNAGGSAFVAALALSNLEILNMALGGFAPFAVLIGAAVIAAVGILRPVFSAPAAFFLLGIAICVAGHPLVGVVLMLFTGIWWYITGREGLADTNSALFGPIAGGLGVGVTAPFAAGLSLRPIQAAVTVAFTAVLACVFSSYGSNSLLGWDMFANWNFYGTDLTTNFLHMIMRPLTWTMLASWIIAGVALSLLSLTQKRWGFISGMILAVIVIMAGMLVFTDPTPQLFLSLMLAVAVVLVLYL